MTLGALAAGVAAACLVLALCGVTLGLRLVSPLGTWRLRRSRREGEASIVQALEALAGGTRAGLVLQDALVLARDRAKGELADRLGEALARAELGDPVATAIGVARIGASPRVDLVLANAQLCALARLGSDRIAAMLEDVLGSFRFEQELGSDIRARTAGQRFQVWLLAAIVPGLALYLAAMSPTLAGELASPLGRSVLIPAGVVFELAGVLMTRRVLARACP